jgi:peptidoglycan L-alanyl-D-glutamate endopeptidase CwlK
MPQFSKSSLEKLSTCHIDLHRLFNEVIKHYECTILEGHRSDEDQLKAFNAGKSKIKSGGKHNHLPSLAIDVAPDPLDWKDKEKFYHFIGFVKATAIHLGIKIRCGGDWDGDNDLKDQTFFDLPHFELIEK